jgi:hypothetical protein
MNMRFLSLCLTTAIVASAAFAQSGAGDVGIRANLAGGDVESIDSGKIVIKTKDGAITALISDKTEFKRVPPGNPSIQAAVPSELSAIGAGDKVLVTGMVSADKATVPARSVYLLTKSDLAERQRKESEEWRTRGIAGKVTTYNPQTNTISVSVRGLTGERTVTVTPKPKAEYLRYSPDSVAFADAKKSSFGEIEPGDTIRALGDRNADGSEFQAEKIVTGAFQTIAGTVTSVNETTGEILISDVQSKKPMTVVVGAGAVMKQFPADMIQRFAMMGGGMGGMGGGQVRPPQGSQPQGGASAQGQGRPAGGGMGAMGGGMRGGASAGIDDLLDRFPSIKIGDLKPGEMIAVSSSRGRDANRVRAIKLLSGVEPLIRAQQSAPRAGGGRGGAGAGFEIPGLDGFNF